MTLIVATSQDLYADTKLTCVVDCVDARGTRHELKASIEDFCKIGPTQLVDDYGKPVHAVALFGEVNKARHLLCQAEAIGLSALMKLMPFMGETQPTTGQSSQIGFVFINSRGANTALVVQNGQYEYSTSNQPRAFGSGAGGFNFLQHLGDFPVEDAFLWACATDNQSSTYRYNHYHRPLGQVVDVELDQKTYAAFQKRIRKALTQYQSVRVAPGDRPAE